MVSKCCKAEIYLASSLYSAQIDTDWYECSACLKHCDTMLLNYYKEEKRHEQFS